jgi:hypothetical protein
MVMITQILIKLHSILPYIFLSQLRNSLFCMRFLSVSLFSVDCCTTVHCNVVQDFLSDPDFSEAERAPVLFNQEINAHILYDTQF